MDSVNTETVLDEALAASAAPKAKYKPGMYRSDRFMRIIKELTLTHQKDDSGKVKKTYGTWAKESNMIVFKKGVERYLNAEDLKLMAIQRLIDSKVIYRVGD